MTTLRASDRPPIAPEADEPILMRSGDRMDSETFIELYERSPEGFRAELIGGIVYVAYPMSFEHGAPNLKVSGWLFCYQARTPGVEPVGAATVRLAPGHWPEPDASMLILPEFGGQASLETRGASRYIAGAPELVVEMSYSTQAIDLNDKRAAYEAAGVREYVVVLVPEREVRWFALREGRFGATAPDADGLFKSSVFPGLWLDPRALLVGDAAAIIAAVGRGTGTPEHAAFVADLAARKVGAG